MWKDPIVKGGTEELGDKFGDNSVECWAQVNEHAFDVWSMMYALLLSRSTHKRMKSQVNITCHWPVRMIGKLQLIQVISQTGVICATTSRQTLLPFPYAVVQSMISLSRLNSRLYIGQKDALEGREVAWPNASVLPEGLTGDHAF